MVDDDFVPQPGAKQRPGLSLTARAVALLSRREHSRVELARKLAPHAQDPDEIARLLDQLEAEGWQSDTRYVQGLVHRKSAVHGLARIAQSLKQQGISDTQITEVRHQLKDTEIDRARSVWEKRFSAAGLPTNPGQYARQGRFLAARGFSHEVIHKILKNRLCDDQ